MAGFNNLPKVGNVGAQWTEERGHRCGRCANPHTSSGGNEACPGNKSRERAPQVVPYLPEKAEMHTFFGFDE